MSLGWLRGLHPVERDATLLRCSFEVYGMPDHEADIATYLTLDGHVFIAPQYNIAYDRDLDEGGSCPDFVALDLKLREVVIVEVTAGADLKPLFGRIKQRETRWYGPIRRKLQEVGAIADDWRPTRFLGFIRHDGLELANRTFSSDADVAFCAIEQATFLWKYWTERIQHGLPR